jgi:hypothetical protein
MDKNLENMDFKVGKLLLIGFILFIEVMRKNIRENA